MNVYNPPPAPLITLFMAGDVMSGTGIDQILPHPSDPTLYEPFTKSAINIEDVKMITMMAFQVGSMSV